MQLITVTSVAKSARRIRITREYPSIVDEHRCATDGFICSGEWLVFC